MRPDKSPVAHDADCGPITTSVVVISLSFTRILGHRRLALLYSVTLPCSATLSFPRLLGGDWLTRRPWVTRLILARSQRFGYCQSFGSLPLSWLLTFRWLTLQMSVTFASSARCDPLGYSYMLGSPSEEDSGFSREWQRLPCPLNHIIVD